ncbi:hypothetical protein QMZ05_07910 [Bradyrhizobium sp. INPA03-11B]|uniref:hypothetical protein n=1 Tax=Bradyrhizobium sp. INPA03-11B TaxID=418598 RepID=UPI00338F8FB8
MAWAPSKTYDIDATVQPPQVGNADNAHMVPWKSRDEQAYPCGFIPKRWPQMLPYMPTTPPTHIWCLISPLARQP